MTPNSADLQTELVRRHRAASLAAAGFLILDIALVVIAFLAKERIFRPGDRSLVMGLWIAVLVFGLGAFVIRRTKFNQTRLKDIAALRGVSGLLKTLQDTTIKIACIGGAIALMGFVITIRTGDWTNMLRAGGVAAIVLIYGFPSRRAWERVVSQLGPDNSELGSN
jgi:acylphosphatase